MHLAFHRLKKNVFPQCFFFIFNFQYLKKPTGGIKNNPKKKSKKQNRFLALSGQHAGQPTPGQQGVVLCVFFKLI